MNPPIDPKICPLCGEPNACGLAEGESTCWCFGLEIPAAAVDAIPPEAAGLACICRRCAERAGAADETKPS